MGTPVERIEVCGVPVDDVAMDETVAVLMSWRGSTPARVAIGVNANSAFVARSDAVYRDDVWRSDLAYPDGQSVVWASRMLGGRNRQRVATTDLIHPLTKSLTRHQSAKIFLLGGRPAVVEEAARRLEELYPGLTTQTKHGYFDRADHAEIVEQINTFRPDVLLVGLGDPGQQRWVQLHRSDLNLGIVLTCGGLFDWLSGAHRRAPRWMIKLGLEWLWRIFIEPRRLLKRYVFGNAWFLGRLITDLIHRRGT